MIFKIGNLQLDHWPVLLAPMEGVSDPSFRNICHNLGADIVYTEFISSEGLIRDAVKSSNKLNIENDNYIGIQIFGNNISSMIEAAKIAATKNPLVIDSNCGCPVKKVVNKGCGAALLKDIDLMIDIAKNVVKHIPNIPITVKTRLGWDYKSIYIHDVVKKLQEVGIQMVTIHARTRCQMYTGEANWNYIRQIKDDKSITIPIIGNGDIDDYIKALNYKNKYNVDGIMIGRAAIGNPWIFQSIKQQMKINPSLKDRIDVLLEHANNIVKCRGEKYGILLLRKHYNHYFNAIPNFKRFKMKLMNTCTLNELNNVINEIKNEYQL